MKVNVFQKRNVIVYIGGDPEKNQPPEITLELINPQIKWDADKNVVVITETR